MSTSIIEWAIYYASLGLLIIPLLHKRQPLTSHGARDASGDASTIRKWWERWPNAIPAIVPRPESVAVVDVDRKDGRDGFATLHAFQEQGFALPRTWQQATPHDGAHLFFRHPGNDLRNDNGRSFHGIDIRSNNYYVVAAPATDDGKSYRWLPGASPWETPLADYPAWLRPSEPHSWPQQQPAAPAVGAGGGVGQLGVAADPAVAERACKYVDAMPASVSGRGGHNALFAATQALVNGFLLPDDWVHWIIATRFNPRCTVAPGATGHRAQWTDAEIRHKIAQAHAHPPHKPRGWLLDDRQAVEVGRASARHLLAQFSSQRPRGGGEVSA